MTSDDKKRYSEYVQKNQKYTKRHLSFQGKQMGEFYRNKAV